MKKPSR